MTVGGMKMRISVLWTLQINGHIGSARQNGTEIRLWEGEGVEVRVEVPC